MTYSVRKRVMLSLAMCGFCLTDTAPAGDRYAFLVGVRQYDKTQLTSLAYTEADVTALAEALKKAGYDEANIVLMTQTRGANNFRYLPSSQQIRKELDLLLGELSPDDTLLLAFSGHGVQFKDETSVYFCPMDAKLAQRSTLLSLTDIYDALSDRRKCKAQTKVLLVDACRNDPQSRLSKAGGEIELEPAGVQRQPDPPGGVAAFFSCSRGQKSYEHPELGHGIFANYVIEAFSGKGDLDKDGEISLAELEQYSVKQTQRYVRVELGERQTPERRGTIRGLVPLADLKTRSRPPSVSSPKEMKRSVTPTAEKGELVTNSIGMKLKLIPAGEFLMGSGISALEVENRFKAFGAKADQFAQEHPQHRVRIPDSLYVGIHEVTVGQFRSFVNDATYRTEPEKKDVGGYGWNTQKEYFEVGEQYSWNNTGFPQSDSHPVVNVTWNDAQAFCHWLSQKEGRTYRLPTEAEWEYACRAGTDTLFWNGDDPEGLAKIANVADGTAKAVFSSWTSCISAQDGYAFSAPAGSYPANAFGLHDMHGNVWEWCGDGYRQNYTGQSTVVDPKGPLSSPIRVLRGGSWNYEPNFVRSAYRKTAVAAYREAITGFRVVMEP